MGAFDRVVQWAKAYNEKEMERIRASHPPKEKSQPQPQKRDDYRIATDAIYAEFAKIIPTANQIIKTFPVYGPGKFRNLEDLWNDAEKTINRFFKKLIAQPAIRTIFEAVVAINNGYIESHPGDVGPLSMEPMTLKELQNSFKARSEYGDYMVVVDADGTIDNQCLSLSSGMPSIIADLLEHCYPSDIDMVGTGDGDEGCVYLPY